MSTAINTTSPDAHGHAIHGHDPHLAHHFDTPEQQNTSAKLGMWVFLGTEILMFGGLFCAYSVYRHNHPDVFAFAAEEYLNTTLGAINTVILITSSLTMAWGVRAAQLNQRTTLIICLILTLCGAAGFMIVKTIEYRAKWNEHVFVGFWNKYNGEYVSKSIDTDLPPDQPVAGPAAVATGAIPSTAPSAFDANDAANVSQVRPQYNGPTGMAVKTAINTTPLTADEKEAQMSERYRHLSPQDQWRVNSFFSCYFLMTGLHGFHVLIGMGLITWIMIRAIRRDFSSEYYTPVDLVGLYWHLVDLIWIFLFPLLYLIH
ncbi:MAG: cytochrome c oxidase subunit 3 family protein [Planctomycetota bacterium]|nr:cytochrome c oxidase subunit 3 family protein [Planctomycetota bacterium]